MSMPLKLCGESEQADSVAMASAVLLGGWFIVYGWRLWRRYSEKLARRTFWFSIWHLSLLFAALLIDHYIP